MVNIKVSKFRLDIILLLVLSLVAPLFFYKLGQSSLSSFDEAWYGDIARNILSSNNPFLLHWNGQIFTDHPPAGYWLIALSEKIFGVSEFSVRFAPALCGFLSIFIIYLLGKELFNRWVGLVSGIALTSATWFLFRSRSGNLDSILTMFFLLTLLLGVKAIKEKRYLLPLSVSLALLILTKTLVPVVIIPSLIIIFWKKRTFRVKDLLLPAVILTIILGSWLLVQILSQPAFLSHYLAIGLPGVKAETSYLDNFKQIKEYLHNGVGKWFWLGILSIVFGLFLRQKSFYILAAFFFTFFVPFLFSTKGHIWHLIPLHPILILTFFGFVYVILDKFIQQKFLIYIGLLIVSIYISFIQIRQSWYQFIDVPAYISDEAILSAEAGKYPYDFYIDGDFGPAAVFYSGKNVSQISRDTLIPLVEGEKQFITITYQWRLDQDKIDARYYKILKTDRDKLLIVKN